MGRVDPELPTLLNAFPDSDLFNLSSLSLSDLAMPDHISMLAVFQMKAWSNVAPANF